MSFMIFAGPSNVQDVPSKSISVSVVSVEQSYSQMLKAISQHLVKSQRPADAG